MPTPGAVVPGEGWLEAPEWLARARRQGPLRYSDLGPRRLPPIADEEAEPLAAWIAGAADRWWDAAGRPDPYTLVVASGDGGRLAEAVLSSRPRCGPALRYVLVDPGYAGRSDTPPGLARVVPLEEPAFLYPSAPAPHGAWGTDETEEPLEVCDLDLESWERPPARGIGPLATFLTEVPALGDADGAVVAVEFLSRLPYELFQRRDGTWFEVRVAASGDDLVEMEVPVGDGGSDLPRETAAGDGADRWRRLSGASAWLRRQLPTAAAGMLAVVDRWSAPPGTDSLDLDQLRHVREPLVAVPEEVRGTHLSAVIWRLG